jgi:hypothetical protein
MLHFIDQYDTRKNMEGGLNSWEHDLHEVI